MTKERDLLREVYLQFHPMLPPKDPDPDPNLHHLKVPEEMMMTMNIIVVHRRVALVGIRDIPTPVAVGKERGEGVVRVIEEEERRKVAEETATIQMICSIQRD